MSERQPTTATGDDVKGGEGTHHSLLITHYLGLGMAGSFLTVLPFPSAASYDRRVLTAGVALFPVIGVAVGATLGLLGLALDQLLPASVTAVLLLAVGTLVTGGLHLDGLMDTADGVFGGATPERRLEIMRDSRVGSYGVLAGGLALLGQYACLGQLTGVRRLVVLAVALGLSRWALVLALGVFPSARPTGLGATFRADASWRAMAIATLVAVAIAAAFGALGLAGLAMTAASVLGGGRFLAARLGGLTGDTYGALAVVSETLVLVAAVAIK